MVQIHKCSSNWLWEKFNLSVATCFVFKKLDNFDPSPALLDPSSFMSMCCCYFTSSAYQVFSASKYSFLNLRPFSLNDATFKDVYDGIYSIMFSTSDTLFKNLKNGGNFSQRSFWIKIQFALLLMRFWESWFIRQLIQETFSKIQRKNLSSCWIGC